MFFLLRKLGHTVSAVRGRKHNSPFLFFSIFYLLSLSKIINQFLDDFGKLSFLFSSFQKWLKMQKLSFEQHLPLWFKVKSTLQNKLGQVLIPGKISNKKILKIILNTVHYCTYDLVLVVKSSHPNKHTVYYRIVCPPYLWDGPAGLWYGSPHLGHVVQLGQGRVGHGLLQDTLPATTEIYWRDIWI